MNFKNDVIKMILGIMLYFIVVNIISIVNVCTRIVFFYVGTELYTTIIGILIIDIVLFILLTKFLKKQIISNGLFDIKLKIFLVFIFLYLFNLGINYLENIIFVRDYVIGLTRYSLAVFSFLKFLYLIFLAIIYLSFQRTNNNILGGSDVSRER